jgi:hypothetical protein
MWFVLRHRTMFRFVEPTIVKLVAEGHDVRVSFALQEAALDAERIAESGAVLEPFAANATSRRARFIEATRTLVSYLSLRRSWPPLLRRRWLEYFPSNVGRALRAADAIGLGQVLDRARLPNLLRSAVSRFPPPRSVEDQLRNLQPDLVIASPMIYPGSGEIDAVRAGQRAGVPTAGIVLSWDNLTSKGIFYAVPDRVFVWNERQREEAVRLHGINPDRVEISGAAAFDYLFETDYDPGRAETLRLAKLSPDARYVLYAGTSSIGLDVGGEVAIVLALAQAIRAAKWPGPPPELIVRPHPRNSSGWEDVMPQIHVWPTPSFPDSALAKAELVGTVKHADAVVALNTSLFVDAAVLGTPAIALAPPPGTTADQDPTRLEHFRHLTEGRFLDRARNVEEVVSVLQRLRTAGDERAALRAEFVRAFVRPLGLDRSPSTILAQRLASAQ